MILLVWYLLYLNTNKTQVIINILKNTKQTKQNIFLRIQNKTKSFIKHLTQSNKDPASVLYFKTTAQVL